MPVTKSALDLFDRKIITVLADKGYLKNTELAKEVGLSTSACHQRMVSLKQRGIIEGFSAEVDVSKITKCIRVMTLIMIEKQDSSEFNRINERLRMTPQIVRAHRVSGDYDYAIETLATDFEAYRSLIDNILRDVEVKQIQSRVMHESIKVSNNASALAFVDDHELNLR